MLWIVLRNFTARSRTFPCYRFISSSTMQAHSNEIIRQRIEPYLDRSPTFVEKLEIEIPRLKRLRRASVLIPMFCNQKTNRIEVLLIKRSEKMRSHTGMIGKKTSTTSIISIMKLCLKLFLVV